MATRDARYIKKMFEHLKSERSTWDVQMQEIAEYVFPAVADQDREISRYVEKRDRLKVNDSTPVLAANLLARAIHGAVTPPNLPWVDFRLRNSEVSAVQSVRDWIGEVKQDLQTKFNESNFDDEMSILFKYLIVFGTAGLIFEEYFDEDQKNWGFLFTALSPREIYFTENWKGYADTVYRRFSYSLEQIKQRWPEALDTSEKLRKEYEKDPDKITEIIHFCSPKRDGERTSNKNHLYISKYVSTEYDLILNKNSNGFFTMPYMVIRWERIRGQEMGNSPARDAIPFIKTLNNAVGLQLEAYDKALNPPIMHEQGAVDGEFDLSTRAVNEVMDIDRIKSFIDGARYDVAEFLVTQLREEIKRMFFADQIQISQEGKTPPSATQVNASLELKTRILGPMFGRHRFELLNPMVERAFDIMSRHDLLPETPSLLEDEAILDPEYIGPLARAQKMAQAEQVQNYIFVRTQMLSSAPPEVISQNPEILFKINYNAVDELLAESLGVSDLGIMRSNDEVNQLSVALRQQQQAAQLAALTEQGAGAAKDIAATQKMANGG